MNELKHLLTELAPVPTQNWAISVSVPANTRCGLVALQKLGRHGRVAKDRFRASTVMEAGCVTIKRVGAKLEP